MRDVLRAGADKVSLNTAAVGDPTLVARCAARLGQPAGVVAHVSLGSGAARLGGTVGRGRTRAVPAAGRIADRAREAAVWLLNPLLTQRAAVRAYVDVSALSAIGAFAAIPLTFLFRDTKAGAHGG